MQESRIIRHLLRLYGFFVFAVIFGSLGTEARAEDTVHIIREAAGDLEQLEAIEISDEEISEWEIAESVQDTSNRASAAANQFLNYCSNYGYQDMAKRSNGAGRQYVYQQLKAISRNFTVNGQDAGLETYSGNAYYIAGVVDLSNYNLTNTEKAEIYFTFRHDNPQYFWLSNSVLYGSNSLIVLTYDEYRDGAVRQSTLEEIVQTAQEIYQSAIDVSDSNYQKILKIHDALIADIEYSQDTSIPTAHSIAGAMTSGKSAVCEGYAKVMQVMMNQYGIMNIYVTGIANGGGHAWNMVKMSDGRYYWLDATWDDQQYEEYQHQYFLVGNANFMDHEADLSTGSGTEFLYELPQVSEEDYVYDPADDDRVDFMPGDVNEDGEVNVKDLQIILRGVCEKIELTERQKMIADVVADGKVDIQDLQKELRFVCGKITQL